MNNYKLWSLVFCLWSVVIVGSFPAEARTLFLQAQSPAAGQPAGEAPAIAAKKISENYPLQSFKLKFANAKSLSDTLKDLLSEGEEISVNEMLNTLVVRASVKDLERLEKLINKMDTPPLQVQVEAKIIEMKTGLGDTSNPTSVGASWKYSRNANTYAQSITTDISSAAASSLGLYAQLLSGNVSAYLSALEKSIGYDLVASPWITALNHETAEILIGSKLGYKTTLTTTTGTMQNIQFLEVGTKLKFTPHINEEGYVAMEIYPSVSEGSIIGDLPQMNTTETKNKVLVKDGQSIVIGGLTKNYNNELETGIPILMHIPFLGNIFKRTQMVSEKREIMVIITPHIVTPEFLDKMLQKAQKMDDERVKWGEGIKRVIR